MCEQKTKLPSVMNQNQKKVKIAAEKVNKLLKYVQNGKYY